MHAVLPLLKTTDFPPLTRRTIDTLQVNLGYVCNQACLHCHVNASPDRTEMMGHDTIDEVIAVLRARRPALLDITGGAPELNALGYGQARSGLVLNLVYNPVGPFLPPPQPELEATYKRELFERHGIVFGELYTLANMPIARFGSTLVSRGQFASYMQLLRGAHRDDNVERVMCRTLVSIDWRGYLYDCDFNQMLGIPLAIAGRPRLHVSDLLKTKLDGAPIAVADHCYGCTAGQGSSCGGALG